jgi:signal transduction histidine kinase
MLTESKLATRCQFEDQRSSESSEQDIISAIVHDMRTPLTTIRTYAAFLGRKNPQEGRAFEVIIAQTDLLARLLGDLLETSSLEGARVELRCTRVDLIELARTAARQAGVVSHAHTIRLEVTEPEIVGWWDPDRLQQILQNLLTNAIKYSPNGGEILLRVERGPTYARITVRDHGLGITAEALPRIFECAYRAGATANVVKGLGLGLYICKGLVEAHGGSINAESQSGRGSTFTVTLPLNT